LGVRLFAASAGARTDAEAARSRAASSVRADLREALAAVVNEERGCGVVRLGLFLGVARPGRERARRLRFDAHARVSSAARTPGFAHSCSTSQLRAQPASGRDASR
jgi:hypothetical protein